LAWATGDDARGRSFNAAWQEFSGRPEEALRGEGWLAGLHPEDRAAVVGAHVACGRDRVAFELEYRMRDVDGRDRWFLARGKPDAESGCVAVAFDVTERHLAEAQRRDLLARTDEANAHLSTLQALTASLAALTRPGDVAEVVLGQGAAALGAASGSLCLLAEDGATLEVAAQIGYPDELVQRWGRFPLGAATPAGDALRAGAGIYLSTQEELHARYPIFGGTAMVGDEAIAVLPLASEATGPLGAMVFGFGRPRQFPLAERLLLDGLAAQATLALARTRSRAALETARTQLVFLAGASQRLAASLDLDQTLATVAELAVPRLADSVGIYLLVDGRVESRLWAPSDPLQGPEAGGGAVVIPLRARGQLRGALALVNRSGDPMTEQQRALAEELAARAAVAIDNARLYAAQVSLAHRLQASLLPPSLPVIEGLDLAARYAPAGDGAEVGGDFYDCIRIARNRLLLVVGDVKGKGVDAAGLTGMARHVIRATATTEHRPAAILTALNDALFSQEVDRLAGRAAAGETVESSANWEEVEPRFCTVLIVSLARRGRGFHALVASAGHPLPLLRDPAGKVRAVGRTGPLLGVLPTVELPERGVTLLPGSLLLCYTDGVSECHDGRQFFDEEGILGVLAGAEGTAAVAAAAVERAARACAPRGEVRDDMAILAVGVL
jgi:PAS domain S-box-containing protein